MADGCRIECVWDRPVKPLAQPSRHYLLVRLLPVGTGLAPSAAPVGNTAPDSRGGPRPTTGAASGESADGAGPVPTALHLTIALDASRSMEEQGRFNACVAACAALAGRINATDSFELAVFSKDLRPQLSARPGGAAAVAEVQRTLGAVRPRGVTRTDLALRWCAERLAAADGALKLALLVTDGDPTDDMGYPVAPDTLLAQAQQLVAQGAQLCTAGVGSAEAYNAAGLHALAEAGGGQFIYSAEAGLLATRLLSRLPAGDSVVGGGGALRLGSRQAGLEVRSAVRLRPLPAQLELTNAGSGWLLDPGPLYGRQAVEMLLEVRLPAAAFGTAEGPNEILTLALDGAACGADGQPAHAEAVLDYSGDAVRVQQLNPAVDQERRQWELRGHAGELQQLSAAELRAPGAAETLLCRIEDAARYSGHRAVAAQAAEQVAQLRQTGLLTRSGAAELAEAARAAQQAGTVTSGLVGQLEWEPGVPAPPGGVP